MPSLKVLGQEQPQAHQAAPAPSGEEGCGSGCGCGEQTLAPSEQTVARGWFRSVDEYAGKRGLGAQVQPVMPGEAIPDSLSRRNFLQLLGGGLGLAGLQGCFKPPNGHILPYGKQPVNLLPGEPLHYATGLDIDGVVTPLLVTCFDGRPIKVEGNPQHPENAGTTGVFEQAILEQLYDSNRVQDVSERGQVRSEDSLRHDLSAELKKLDATQGAGLRFLVSPTSSPLVQARRAQVLHRFPKAKFVEHSPLGAQGEAGTREAFGEPFTPTFELGKADVVVSLDADFLWTVPYGHRMAREFAARRVAEGGQPMNRLYTLESNLSITGMMADHRIRVRSSDIGRFALALLYEVSVLQPFPGVNIPAMNIGAQTKTIQAMARDLVKNERRSAVLVGYRQPAEVQAVGHLLNFILGNIGQTVTYAPVAAGKIEATGAAGLRELAKDIDQKKVELLVVTAADPVYSAPGDVDLAARIGGVPFSVYLAPYADATAAQARWVLPAAHPFETWSDAVAADGSHVVCQPLLAPLFGGRSEAEVLGWAADDATEAHALIYDNWHQHIAPTAPAFDDIWGELVRTGFTPPSAEPPARTPAVLASAADALNKIAQVRPVVDLELSLYPSYQVHDGRYARNGQLLELPDPVTKLTWTNAALLSPKTAEKLGVAQNDILELGLHGRNIQVPAIVLPGHADESVSVALGFGQKSPLDNDRFPLFISRGAAGPNTDGLLAGASAYPLRHSDAPWFATGLTVKKTGGTRDLALSQEHWTMEGRELALEMPLAKVGTNPALAGELSTVEPQSSFYEPVKYEGLQWAMAIDLARCTGCSACVMACQTENNIPVVGEEQVKRGREMHWLRLDRYFTEESVDDPGAITQPVACVHCEDAPCEYVCPVNATVHSDEGLNEMVYNRCVGTRYCSNNCPYHVRRFNYLNYQYGNKTETEKMVFNPEVTVRSRGVMEKCTYCVQRIERGRISARVQGREIKDGDIKTACQTACPTQAISFGTLSDPASKVSQLRNDPRSYQLLKEVGTRPRTTHLVRIKNKNPELAS